MDVLTSLQADAAISYLIAFILPALDAIFPALPSETAIIGLGVATAGSTDPRIALLVATAAAGAFAGDNLSYLIGRRFGPAVERRFFSTPKGKAARAWAERSLQRFGMPLIIVCRFIPGGRTAITFTCGLTGYPRHRFVAGTAVAAVIWALQAFLVGRLGGKTFEDRPWAGLLMALGISIAISALIEGARRLRARRRPARGHAGQSTVRAGQGPDGKPVVSADGRPARRPRRGRGAPCRAYRAGDGGHAGGAEPRQQRRPASSSTSAAASAYSWPAQQRRIVEDRLPG